jgi:hypothetical protein
MAQEIHDVNDLLLGLPVNAKVPFPPYTNVVN